MVTKFFNTKHSNGVSFFAITVGKNLFIFEYDDINRNIKQNNSINNIFDRIVFVVKLIVVDFFRLVE